MAAVLLVALAIPLGSYFWVGYRGDSFTFPIQEKMLTAHNDLFAVHLSDRGKGWVVGKYGLILHTPDGGKTWERMPSVTTKALTAVSFADELHGFAVGSGGNVITTTDGGSSWKLQASKTKDHLLGLHVLSQRVALVVGAFGTILSTTNGGGSWKRHRLSWEKLIPRIINEGGYMEPNLNAVHFVTRDTGWVVGEFGLVLRTTDGGQTWVSQRYGVNLPRLLAVVFRDENTGFAVGQKGTLIKTVDGGKHWLEMNVGTQQNLNEISMDDKQGVIVGDGVVLKTKDGGLTWTLEDSFPSNIWLSGVALNHRGAVAVGQGGFIRAFEF